MAVIVKIELWPFGVEAKKRLLQTVKIANVGGDVDKGVYAASLSHSSTYQGDGTLGGGVWRVAHGIEHRRNLSPSHLVRTALCKLLNYTDAKLGVEGWVRVDERLPEEGVTVLGFWGGNTMETCDFTTERGWTVDGDAMLVHPSHWMPLPPAPIDTQTFKDE